MAEPSIINNAKIQELREAKGLTQEEAAVAAGLRDRQDWNSIEKGRRVNLTVATLAKIAKALDCNPCDLLTAGTLKKSKKAGG